MCFSSFCYTNKKPHGKNSICLFINKCCFVYKQNPKLTEPEHYVNFSVRFDKDLIIIHVHSNNM